jgi:hypothetical protein
MTGVILCLDAAYGPVQAAAAGGVIDGWDARATKQMLVRRFESPPEIYQPGAFYKRELPLLLPLIADVDAPIGIIVIDGYVWLSPNGQPGLGGPRSRSSQSLCSSPPLHPVSIKLSDRRRDRNYPACNESRAGILHTHEIFARRGLSRPTPLVTTFSVYIQLNLVAGARLQTMLPARMAR